jgi:hypothetical protein
MMQSRPLFVVRHIRQRGENTRQKEPDHKIFAVSNYCECSDDMTLIVDRCWEVIEAELQNEGSTLPCKLEGRALLLCAIRSIFHLVHSTRKTYPDISVSEPLCKKVPRDIHMHDDRFSV